MNTYKIVIAAIAVLTMIMINFYTSKRLPLLSTKLFSALLIVSMFNLIFDAVSLWGIYNYETLNTGLNRLFQQMFAGSMNLFIFILFLYVYLITKGQKRPGKRLMLLMTAPLFVSILMVCFGSINYYVGEDGAYTHGVVAASIYFSVAVYVALIVILVVRSNIRLDRDKTILFFGGSIIQIVVALIQFVNPTVLLSALGNVLMVLLIYLVYENPREYLDKETGALEAQAFVRMIEEMCAGKKSFYVISYVLGDAKYIRDAFGYRGMTGMLMTLNKDIQAIKPILVFHPRSNILTVVTKSEKLKRILSEAAENQTIDWVSDSGYCYQPSFHLDIMECSSQTAADVDNLYNLIDYISSNHEHEHEGKVNFVDETLIEQYKRFAAIEVLVEDAVKNDGFDVVYQPIYSNETKAFSSAEALVRLKDTETLGFVSPEIFIPLAEQRGWINDIGNAVFEKVCKFIKEEQLVEKGISYIEVNLSGIQGVDRNLVGTLTGYMKKYDINPKNINLEITETASVESGEMLINNMNSLREYGCHFSMDDFGTGYSNLSQVAKVRYEMIKLDKSLIWPCFEDGGENARIILDNCINMITNLGIKIVAEGVETKEQADMLTAKGVTYLQGYYFSRPLNRALYMEFLNKHAKA